MKPDPDDDTIIRPRIAGPAEPADLDSDTVLRERTGPLEFTEPPELVDPPAGRRKPAAELPDITLPLDQDEFAPPYRFVVNSHEPIGLDAPALIGRRPSVPRIPARDRPRLVRVPSPLQEVSGTHLELRQQGASVIVTDLNSTNGTIVEIPGSAPLKLRQGESVVVVPGTVVDIGDGNVVTILAARAGSPGEPEA